MTEGAAQKFESLPKLLDRISAESYEAGYPVIVEHHDWYRISKALRLASAWLRAYDEYIDGDLLDCTDYVERFRRALEGSPDA